MSTTQSFLVILASQSPQRSLLLKQLGVPFEQKKLADLGVFDVESLEVQRHHEPPADYVVRVAQQKWLAAQPLLAQSKKVCY